MKVLFVASEAYPFIKTGGLGDVAYALPKALRKLGIDARVIIPKYEGIPSAFKNCMENIASFTVAVGWRNQYCGLEYLTYDEIPYYFVDNQYYFNRPEIYGYYDDGERFSYFSKAVLESIKYGRFKI
jgi:starch synthase